MTTFESFVHDLLSPHFAWAHLPYLLFVLSMIMRRIIWLRGIAVIAGLTRIYIRLMILYDPVTVLWESTLVFINVGQLLLIWYDSRQNHTTADEAELVSRVAPGVPRRTVRLLLRAARWADLSPETVLTSEGKAVEDLTFVASGAARVERQGALVAVCARGDFVGEMSFVSGDAATATVVAEDTMRVARFKRTELRTLMDRDPQLRHALEASFNRNLIGKLSRPQGPPASA